MFIPTETKQISVALDNAKECLKTSLMESSTDTSNGLPPVSELSHSPPPPVPYTDVNVVPEQERDELQQLILNLEGEISKLKSHQRSLDDKRKEALNQILDIKGAIRVFCRIRPFLLINKTKVHEPISAQLDRITVRSSGSRKEFAVDKVLHQAATQEDIFSEVQPILRSALDGHNVCIFAYGQTGTGKTYTMDGTTAQPGIVPRALEELFHQASLSNLSSVSFSLSMLEIYMGNLRDLLAPKQVTRPLETVGKCNLSIQTDAKGLIEIEGLTEVQIPDIAKAIWWYTKGRRLRSTSWTNVNEASSRSHCLIRITISQLGYTSEARKRVSKLWMIDLGGSERLLKTGAMGQTLDEGRTINLSLSALGDVIAALKRKKGHVPYRNSKLTQILKDSLGIGSKVLMLVHISPHEEDIGETIYSLTFAKRARAVESSRDLPEDLKKLKDKRIAELEHTIRDAEEECKNIGNQIKLAGLLLSENKKLYATSCGITEVEDKDSKSLQEEAAKEIIEAPLGQKKAIKRRNISAYPPRFMNSTVASRQRQYVNETENVAKPRSLRSVGARSSVQLSGSHNLSLFKAVLRNSNKKTRYGECNSVISESPKSTVTDSKRTSLPRSKIITSSDPNIRVALYHHCRRMSDMI